MSTIKLPAEFQSGNSVPVERATITRQRMAQILDEAIEADRNTTSKQLSAYKHLTDSLQERLTLLQAQHDELKKSSNPDLLASERAANAILTAELEADRQKNNALIRCMPEVVAALKATGCNEPLVADIEKSMLGECDRHESEPAYWRITKTDGVIFFECYRAAVENYKKEGWSVEPLYTAPQPQKRGEPVSVPKQAEPSGYAYRYRYGAGGTVLRFNSGEEVNGARPVEAVPFWFAPQPQKIPEGYALVPIEPTQEMKDAADFRSERYGHIATNKYKAMINAAPQPKNQESE